MNWNELSEQIEKMSLQQRLQGVRFIEPYDKERAGFDLAVVYAAGDLTVDSEDEPDTVFVGAGEPFLCCR
jgi:hypothetical protein